MTKTKTKLRVAAAMLAVLLLTCAWVGAVSAENEVAFSYGADTELTNIWKTGSTYWTAKDVTGDVKIPVMLAISGGTATPYMSAYNVGITIKEAGVTPLDRSKYTLSNLITGWTDDAYIYNNGEIASGIGIKTAAMIELTSTPQNLFSIDIPTTELKKETYTTSFDPSVKTVALSAALSSVIDTTGVSSGSQTTTPEFSFYVREKLPKVGAFTITGYDGTFANDVSVTVFRKGGASTTETIAGTGNDAYTTTYDTLTWSPSSGDVPVVGTSGLSATLTLVNNNDADSTQTDVSAEINPGLTGASDKTTIKVTSTPWLISAKDNYNAANNDYEATGYYTEYSSDRIGAQEDLYSTKPTTLGTYWNFATQRKIEYTVSAAQKLSTTTVWDSLIPVSLLWTGGAEKTALTADVTFVSSGADNYVTGKSYGNTFTVTTDTLATHSSDTKVTLTYTGYKLGDANTNGNVDIVDSAVIGIQIIKSVKDTPSDTTGLVSNFLNAEQKIYADCGSATPDGIITVADILAINKYLVGYENPWSSTP